MFLTPALLAGGMAFVAPLLIHLVYRNRSRSIDWGAMYLVAGVPTSRRRRSRWADILLLMLRCLIPLVFALALARPVIDSIAGHPGDTPITLILGIDDSRSMATRTGSGVSRFDHARSALLRHVDSLGPGDSVVVITASRWDASDHPALRPQEAAERIRLLTATTAGSTLDALVGAAVRAGTSAPNRARQIIVVSDFQANVVSEEDQSAWRRLATEMEAADVPPVISFLDVGRESHEPANATAARPNAGVPNAGVPNAGVPNAGVPNAGVPNAGVPNVDVASVVVDAPVVVAGRGFDVVAEVRNSDDRPSGNLRVRWTQDGRAIGSQTVSVAAQSRLAIHRRVRCESTGTHVFGVSAAPVDFPTDGDWSLESSGTTGPERNRASTGRSASRAVADVLPEDNLRMLGVVVRDPMDVWIVDGDPDPRPMAGEADFLATALSPFAFGGRPEADAFRTRVIAAPDFDARIDAAACDVLVLANVARMDGPSRGRVAEFVRGGGGLVVFDGDRVEPAVYNRPWTASPAPVPSMATEQAHGSEFRDESPSIQMPGRMEDWVVADPQADTAIRLGRLDPEFTAWRLLMSPETEAALAEVRIRKHRRLRIRRPAVDGDSREGSSDSLSHPPSTRVLCTTENDDPLVLWSTFGEGVVVQFAVSCDDNVSNLPTVPVFLPLIQQLILRMVAAEENVNAEVGAPMAVAIPVPRETGPSNGKTKGESSRQASVAGETSEPDAGGRFYMQSPDGRITPLAASPSDPRLAIASVFRPGVYHFATDRSRFRDAARSDETRSDETRSDETRSDEARSDEAAEPVDEPGQGGPDAVAESVATESDASLTATRVVQVPSRESVIRHAGARRVAGLAGRLKAGVFTDFDLLAAAQQRGTYGREVGWAPLAMVVVLLLLESYVASGGIARDRTGRNRTDRDRRGEFEQTFRGDRNPSDAGATSASGSPPTTTRRSVMG